MTVSIHIQGICEIKGIRVDKPEKMYTHGYKPMKQRTGKQEPQGIQDVAHTHISPNIEKPINER